MSVKKIITRKERKDYYKKPQQTTKSQCKHTGEIETVRSYRKNYPFGKKGGARRGPARSVVIYCKKCGLRLHKTTGIRQ